MSEDTEYILSGIGGNFRIVIVHTEAVDNFFEWLDGESDLNGAEFTEYYGRPYYMPFSSIESITPR